MSDDVPDNLIPSDIDGQFLGCVEKVNVARYRVSASSRRLLKHKIMLRSHLHGFWKSWAHGSRLSSRLLIYYLSRWLFCWFTETWRLVFYLTSESTRSQWVLFFAKIRGLDIISAFKFYLVKDLFVQLVHVLLDKLVGDDLIWVDVVGIACLLEHDID